MTTCTENLLSIESIAKELKVDLDGKGYVSLRGVARLCGVHNTTFGQGGSVFTKTIDKMIAIKLGRGAGCATTKAPETIGGKGFEGVGRSRGKAPEKIGSKGLEGGSKTIQKIDGSKVVQKIDGKAIQKIDGMPTGKEFEGDNILTDLGVPDVVVTLVIGHYAMDAGARCTDQAKSLYQSIAAIGLRTLIQQATNWEGPRRPRLSREEIVELCVLPVASEWERRFPEEYYTELARLTSLRQEGNKRPCLWAQLTKELIYDYLPPEVYAAIKQCKTESGSWDKLHQYLSNDGLILLEHQQKTVLILMKAAPSIDRVKEGLSTIAGSVQLGIFDVFPKRRELVHA